MRIRILTWNGHSINDGTSYKTRVSIGAGNGMPSATPNFIDVGVGIPVLSGKTLTGVTFTLQVQLLGVDDATREAQHDTLNSWFNITDFSIYDLIGEDIDNSDKQWYVSGFVVGAPALVPDTMDTYNITLALSEPNWLEVNDNSVDWDITSDTETQVVTNSGKSPAFPVFEITPNSQKISHILESQTFIAVHSSGYALTWMRIDLTPDGLDTAALVTAGKMRSDGADLSVWVDGMKHPRWFGGDGINTSNTHVWTYLSSNPFPVMSLSTALDGVTESTTVSITYDSENGLPTTRPFLTDNKSLQIGNEILTYATCVIDMVNNTIVFSGVKRHQKGSSIAAHSIGATVYWIEHDIWITYGDPLQTTYPPNDLVPEGRPQFDIALSTNDYWTYPDPTHPHDYNAPNAGVGWAVGGKAIRYPIPYTNDRYSPPGYFAVWNVYGIRFWSFMVGTVVTSPTNWDFGWGVFHPGGFTRFTGDFSRMRTGASWPTASLETSYDLSVQQLLLFDAPATPSVWEDFSVDETFTGNYPKSVAWRMQGGLGTTLPLQAAYLQLSALEVWIQNPVTVTPIVEQTNYRMSATLENTTNGHKLILHDIVMRIGQTLTIDCVNQDIYLPDGTRLRANLEIAGPARDEWMVLETGSNTIEFTDAGTDDLTVNISWRGRTTL